jgi:thiol:disulfide interchange protein
VCGDTRSPITVQAPSGSFVLRITTGIFLSHSGKIASACKTQAPIDESFRSSPYDKQGTVAAFVAGAVSAILAGACVAPILIAVLLLTTDYVAEGAYWALCLPFVLGLGMAAPWPIAGAGLTFLPRPGAWMVWVKKIFAVIVLLFAGYYGWTAVKTVLPLTASFFMRTGYS